MLLTPFRVVSSTRLPDQRSSACLIILPVFGLHQGFKLGCLSLIFCNACRHQFSLQQLLRASCRPRSVQLVQNAIKVEHCIIQTCQLRQSGVSRKIILLCGLMSLHSNKEHTKNSGQAPGIIIETSCKSMASKTQNCYE